MGRGTQLAARLGEVVSDRGILYAVYIQVLGDTTRMFPARGEGVLTLLIRTEIGEPMGKCI